MEREEDHAEQEATAKDNASALSPLNVQLTAAAWAISFAGLVLGAADLATTLTNTQLPDRFGALVDFGYPWGFVIAGGFALIANVLMGRREHAQTEEEIGNA